MTAATPGAAAERRRNLQLAAIIMVAAFVASRVTGLGRSVAVSYQFGTGRELDAYIAANRIPELLFQVVAAGAVASAFIPVFTGYLVQEDRVGAWRMVSTLFNLALVILVPLGVLLAVFAPTVVGIVAPELEPPAFELATALTQIMLVNPMLFAIGTFTTGILHSHKRFLLPALAPTFYNVGLIVGALGLAPLIGSAGHAPIYGLAFGSVLGALFFLLVQAPGLVQVRMVYHPLIDLGHVGVRKLGALMLPRTLGLAVVQINFVVIIALASGVPGAVAALDYAWQLAMLPLGIFAIAISTAVFPTLADQTARDQIEDMRQTMGATLRLILFLTIPSCVGLVVLAVPIVRVLFERGEFDASSTALTALAVQFYALGLFGQALVEIVTRAFYALQDTRTPVAVAAAAMAVNVALAFLLRYLLGYSGLALALSLAAVFEAAALSVLARRRLGSLDEGLLASSALRSLAAAVGMAVALYGLLSVLGPVVDQGSFVGRVVLVGSAVVTGGATYLVLALVLRVPELRRVRALVLRRRPTAGH